ncbi:MAG: hypothetical protein JWM69_640, partial [Candidatus Binatus sp.]|nr:hypothetical protein [Candidatus Binatus sp.]
MSDAAAIEPHLHEPIHAQADQLEPSLTP